MPCGPLSGVGGAGIDRASPCSDHAGVTADISPSQSQPFRTTPCKRAKSLILRHACAAYSQQKSRPDRVDRYLKNALETADGEACVVYLNRPGALSRVFTLQYGDLEHVRTTADMRKRRLSGEGCAIKFRGDRLVTLKNSPLAQQVS